MYKLTSATQWRLLPNLCNKTLQQKSRVSSALLILLVWVLDSAVETGKIRNLVLQYQAYFLANAGQRGWADTRVTAYIKWFHVLNK